MNRAAPEESRGGPKTLPLDGSPKGGEQSDCADRAGRTLGLELGPTRSASHALRRRRL